MVTSVPSSMIQIRRENDDLGQIREARIGPEEEQNLLLLAVDEADQEAPGKAEEKERPVPEVL